MPAGQSAWVAERALREGRSLRMIARRARFLNALCAMPFIRLVAVSGSLAHLNATDDADLDLFIITKGPRVWSVTAATVVLAKLMRCRQAVCANFVVSDEDLVIQPQDEFSANQILHLRPVIGADAYREFLDANPFVRAMYPNFDPRERSAWPFTPSPWAARVKRVLEFVCSLPSHAFEASCRVTYGWYLRRKVRTWASPEQVRLTRTQLKLHGHSHRQAIQRRFAEATAAIWRSLARRV